jgi:hypothetical protein
MARIGVASNKSQHQQKDDNDKDAQSFGAVFAGVPVPCDILQRQPVIQDEDEAKRASQDRVEQNEIGDGVGHAGNPLFVVCHNNRSNLDNLSGAG